MMELLLEMKKWDIEQDTEFSLGHIKSEVPKGIPGRWPVGFKYSSEAQESLYRFLEYLQFLNPIALAIAAGLKNIPSPRDKVTQQLNT